jgi:hypothetical protein
MLSMLIIASSWLSLGRFDMPNYIEGGQYVIVIDRFPDPPLSLWMPEDLTIIGLFPSHSDAQGFIDSAHDIEDDCPVETCYHINTDDVEYARISYINILDRSEENA